MDFHLLSILKLSKRVTTTSTKILATSSYRIKAIKAKFVIIVNSISSYRIKASKTKFVCTKKLKPEARKHKPSPTFSTLMSPSKSCRENMKCVNLTFSGHYAVSSRLFFFFVNLDFKWIN